MIYTETHAIVYATLITEEDTETKQRHDDVPSGYGEFVTDQYQRP